MASPLTAVPPYAWALDDLEILIPYCLNRYEVNPEQSKPDGELPPLT